MVKTAMAIEREVDDAQSIWDVGVKDKWGGGGGGGGVWRVSFLLQTRGRSRRLLLGKGFRDKVAAIRAKVNGPNIGETSGLPGGQGRGHVSIATSLDT